MMAMKKKLSPIKSKTSKYALISQSNQEKAKNRKKAKKPFTSFDKC
jgi:hypothetical protein